MMVIAKIVVYAFIVIHFLCSHCRKCWCLILHYVCQQSLFSSIRISLT